MKKRSLLLVIMMVVVFQLINHFAFSVGYLGLTLECEKLIVLVITAAYCYFYIRRQARETLYSYSLMANLGVWILLVNSSLFQAYRLFFVFQEYSLSEIYQTVIDAFAIDVALMMPFMLILAVMLTISNLVLIRREGYHWTRTLGIALGLLVAGGSLIGPNLYRLLTGLVEITNPWVDGMIYFAEASLCLTIAYFESMMIAAIICTVKSEHYQPPFDQDFLIILGCKVAPDGQPLPILQGRLDRALAFAAAQQQATGQPVTYIPSGGKGTDEQLSEAQAMSRYLTAHGVTPTAIMAEDQSTTTRENLMFSKRLIEQRQPDQPRTVFATTGYHVWRSGVIAHNIGLRAVGIGAQAPWYFYHNALVREFLANLSVQWRQHVFNLAFINLSIIMMLIAGYRLGIL